MSAILHSIVELPLGLLDRLPALLSLTLISVASGAGILWIVGKLTNQKKLAVARDRMTAAIYEMRLFMDSPLRIGLAQLRLLRWSGVYMAHTLPPLVVILLPLTLLFIHLEVRYAIAPLAVGEPVLVRVDMNGMMGVPVTVSDSPGVRVTAPPLRVEDEGRVYVRVRIDQPGKHAFALQVGPHTVTKELTADPAALIVSPERSAGLASLWALGVEPPIPGDSGVKQVSVAHGARDQTWAGIAMPWWVYWLVVSMAAAMLLRKPMGVVL